MDGKRELADGPPIVANREFAKATLRELANEHNFFSIGCVFTHGGMSEAMSPVQDFVTQHRDPSCAVFSLDLPWTPFSGVARGPSEEVWDRRLFVSPRKFWHELLTFLSGIVLTDTPRGRVIFTRPQLLMLPDRLHHSLYPRKDGKCPVVPVTAFGVTGTHVNAAFVPPPRRPDGVAAVKHLPIDVAVAARGRRLLTGDGDALRR